MIVCLCHVEAIIRDRFFFTNFAFVCGEEGRVKKTFTHVIDSPVHSEHDGEKFSSVSQSVGNLQWLL